MNIFHVILEIFPKNGLFIEGFDKFENDKLIYGGGRTFARYFESTSLLLVLTKFDGKRQVLY